MSPLVLLHTTQRVDLEVPLPLRVCRLALWGDGYSIRGESAMNGLCQSDAQKNP